MVDRRDSEKSEESEKSGLEFRFSFREKNFEPGRGVELHTQSFARK